MAKKGNRVKETTETTGTGTLDLGGAPTGFRAFADERSTGDRVDYLIVDDPDNPTEYEIGFGVFATGTPNTLTRETVLASSNSGNKVSFSAGTKTVVCPGLAGDADWDVASKSDDYTVLVTDHLTLFLVDGSGNSPAGATISLPALANVWPGFEIEVKNTGAAGTVTLDGNGSETIDGATTLALSNQYDTAKLRAGASGWHNLTPAGNLGTAAALDAGTGVGDVVQLVTDGNSPEGARLPALNGEQLTNVPAGILWGSFGTGIAAGATQFYAAGERDTTEANIRIPVPFACTAKNLRVHTNPAAGAGQNIVVTLRDNDGDTSLTVTLADATTEAADTTNSVELAAGELICFKVVASAGASTTRPKISVELVQ